MKTSKSKIVLGIDPGLEGAFILTNGEGYTRAYFMPTTENGKSRDIDFDGVRGTLSHLKSLHFPFHTFLERAVPMAQGVKTAFNYGRGFEALCIAIQLLKLPVTLVEPQKWAKEMHQGISADLKPKAKSLIAAQRLFPSLVDALPKRPKGGYHDGMIDALLIAGYGLRK